MLPKLTAVRIYSSLGAGLLTHNGGVMGGALVPPAAATPSDPNYNTLYDFAELTWIKQAPIQNHPEIITNLGLNVTEVDAFGLVQQFTIEGIDPAHFTPTALSSGFRTEQRRPDLVNTFQSFGSPWSDLIVANRARIVAPNLGINAGLFPADQLDDYINQVFQKYVISPPLTTTVTVPTCPTTGCSSVTYNFTGSTAGGEFVFSDAAKGGPNFHSRNGAL